MVSESNSKFNIQTAAQLSGLSPHTIRAWEKRYQALAPDRSANGRRLYTSVEIDRLIMLSRLTQLGISIGQIAHLPDEELKVTYHKLVQTQSTGPTSNTSLSLELNSETIKNKLLDAVGSYQVDTISQLLSQAKHISDPKTFALEIIYPLICEVKLRCTKGLIQDAQAQALFALAKFHAGNIIYSHFEKSLSTTSKIVLTSFEKEHHSFPLLISALLCCHHKKHFYYLNSNLPAPSIIDAVKATEAQLLILSLPANIGDDEASSELESVINTLYPATKIWLLSDFDHSEKNVAKWKGTKKINGIKELDEALLTSL